MNDKISATEVKNNMLEAKEALNFLEGVSFDRLEVYLQELQESFQKLNKIKGKSHLDFKLTKRTESLRNSSCCSTNEQKLFFLRLFSKLQNTESAYVYNYQSV